MRVDSAAATEIEDIWNKIFRYFRRRGVPHDDARDLAQDSMLRLWSKWDGVPPHARTAYAYRIARNLLLDSRRHAPQLRGQGVAEGAAHMHSDAEIYSLLAELPRSQSLVIELRIVDGYSVDEVAQMLRRSQNSVRSLQYRGITRLRAMLEEDLR